MSAEHKPHIELPFDLEAEQDMLMSGEAPARETALLWIERYRKLFSTYASTQEQLQAAEKQRDACMEMAAAERPPDAVFNKALQDEYARLKEQYQAALDQLERATKFIAKQGMEYRFAEFCGGVANPASGPESA